MGKIKREEKENKKRVFFLQIIKDTIERDYLKLLKLSISWLKGFEFQVEFYEKKEKKEEKND